MTPRHFDIDTLSIAKFGVAGFCPIFLAVGEVFDIKSNVDVYYRLPSTKYEGVFWSVSNVNVTKCWS